MVLSGPYLLQSLIAVIDRELMIINTGMIPMITPAPTVKQARVIGDMLFMSAFYLWYKIDSRSNLSSVQEIL